jgi:hypothetical protein
MFYIIQMALLILILSLSAFFAHLAYTTQVSSWAIGACIELMIAILPAREIYKYHAELRGMPFLLRLQFAKIIIAQVKAGEWTPNPIDYQYGSEIYNLVRNGQKMWVGSGSQFLRIDDKNVFGDLLRLYVWHSAVKYVVNEANSKFVKKQTAVDIINTTLDKKPTLKVVK